MIEWKLIHHLYNCSIFSLKRKNKGLSVQMEKIVQNAIKCSELSKYNQTNMNGKKVKYDPEKHRKKRKGRIKI